jgi:hypothetical protein
MAELLHAMPRSTDANNKVFVFKRFERLLHGLLVELHHRIAARFLIARIL